MEGIPKPLVKKSRSANWLTEEKELLKTLVKEQVSVIENKNTDANTNKKKTDAWNKLCSTFNEVNSTGLPRTVKNLKTQWSMIKMDKKKELSKERKSIMKTGGGSQSPVNHDDDEILSWLPNEFVVDSNEFDSDSVRANIPAETPAKAPSPLIEVIYVVSPEAVENNDNIEMDTLLSTQLPLTESHPQPETTHTAPTPKQPNPKRSKGSKRKRQNKLNEDNENIDLNKPMETLIAMQLKNEEKRSRILHLQEIFWEKKCGSLDLKTATEEEDCN
ncbi:uncharacterized protein LOC105385195 [Plutella xylostella]|uniref:uncharacterized protein LOC105385195 n=1 Tax=Plutella xylostella TaxID=51655 RepID=UPI0005D0A558|nr:uncharacterized protein LOC105385195 [Plutella xylostella]